MSRQFQVYLMPSDAEKIIKEIKKRLSLALIQDSSSTACPVEIQSPVQSRSSIQEIPASRLRCYLVADLYQNIYLNFYKNPDRWLIESSSDAIELSGCDFNGHILLVGRFYFQNDLLIDKNIVKKSQAFSKVG